MHSSLFSLLIVDLLLLLLLLLFLLFVAVSSVIFTTRARFLSLFFLSMMQSAIGPLSLYSMQQRRHLCSSVCSAVCNEATQNPDTKLTDNLCDILKLRQQLHNCTNKMLSNVSSFREFILAKFLLN